MARLSSTNPPASATDVTSVNLNRMIVRLQQTINNPDAETEARLRCSSWEREKVASNIQYARNLLWTLEANAQTLKVQSRKQDTQADLVRKREILQRLSERLEELEELGEDETEEDFSEGEDLLGKDTPPETEDERASRGGPISESDSPIEPVPPPIDSEPLSPTHSPETETEVDPEPQSTLRSRNPRAELFAVSSSQNTGISTATSEALLTHHRTEQESLTNSLLSMAQQLKQSSQAFSSSLEEEKSVLNRATEGLDKNELGLEAASRRMGYLRTMTEGRGWWGRMLMYAWIAGLMVLAILIVFVGPKLRF